MKKNMKLGLAAGLAMLFSLTAFAASGTADYVREKKVG